MNPVFDSPSKAADGSAERVAPAGLTAFDLFQLWRVSRAVFEVRGVRGMYQQLSFLAAFIRNRIQVLRALRDIDGVRRLMRRRPETIGVVVWPYVCASWDAPTRLGRIFDHCSAIDAVASTLNVSLDEDRELLDLNHVMPGLRVVLDKPSWFMREGQVALNLFVAETRVFSVAFSLRIEGTLTACIGGIQGTNNEGILETYKAITGALYGMRPRDFLIDLLRGLCRAIDVSRIYAVADASRHHRHPFFNKRGGGIGSF